MPVCSRSGLTYYFQGEALRALARLDWSVESVSRELSGDREDADRVRGKVSRMLDLALRSLRTRGGDLEGSRREALRRSFPKLPREYEEDLRALAEEFDRGRWE